MKSRSPTPDIVPVFDIRDGADCAHLQFKTWSEMGLRWNSYREYSLSLNCNLAADETPESLMERFIRDIRDIRAKGEHVIACAFHNFALSVIVTA